MLQSIWMQCILCVGIRKTARNIQRRSFEILYQSVSLKAVRNRAWRKNCSAQEAFRHCLKRKKHLEMDAFYYKGDRYKDLNAASNMESMFNLCILIGFGIKTAITMRQLIILERLRKIGNLSGRMEVYMNQSIPFAE